MVALVVMIVAMVGLLQAIGIALEHNLRNQEREEAVYLGEKYMNELRGKRWDDTFCSYSAPYTPFSVRSAARGGGASYTVERTNAPLGADTKLLMVTVKWTFKQVEYQNRVTATVTMSPS